MKLLLFITLFSFSAMRATDYVVLIPGAASSGDQISIRGLESFLGYLGPSKYFGHLNEQLTSDNIATLTCPRTRDNDTRSLNARAKDCSYFLAGIILKKPNSRFHLLGHSMGGLIARKLLDYPILSKFIKSVTTIATPHRGAVLANFALRNHNKNSIVGSFLRKTNFTPIKKKYIQDLRIENGFNAYTAKLQNRRRVPIYSISSIKANYYNALLAVSSKIIRKEVSSHAGRSRINDGIIETSSMIYGKHLGQIKADHMESACILYTVKSRGCENLLNLLMPHLHRLLK